MNGGAALLTVSNLNVSHGESLVVRDLSLEVYCGELVALIGGNGAGKSTVLRALSGLLSCRGSVKLEGREILGLPPEQLVALGIAQAPEGRGIFGNLTVQENLEIATWQRRGRGSSSADMEEMFRRFPRLRERRRQWGETLSGGEQQMLAIARALMSRPKLLLLDEPSMGLAPVLVRELFGVLADINRSGVAVLLVEQNARMALGMATRGYVLETGRVVLEGPGRELLDDPRVKAAYLGG